VARQRSAKPFTAVRICSEPQGLQHRNPFYFMRYSQVAGIITAIALIGICYLPWVYIASIHTTITGLQSASTSFGKPGLLNIVFSTICILFFATSKIWAKRTNVFFATINFAWTVRNYFVLTTCMSGECPQKKAGLYLLLVASLIILIMTFLPRIAIPDEKTE
jgi:hypothetical protein